ncbi:MAG TPA: alpha/beta fold hydrolase [Herpetosiphonaceae bacterium]
MTQRAQTLEKTFVKTLRLSYLLHLPDGYRDDPQRRWPLILFLHGSGERGDHIEQVKRHGLPKILDQRPDFPAIVVSPQCRRDSAWVVEIEALDALFEEITSAYAVDHDRIYLTGLSMGGYGAWHYAALHPDRFAALVPICGGGLWFVGFPDKACILKDVPTWVFHGAQDEVVLLSESQVLVDALQACGGNVRFTVYPDAGHDSWTPAYNDPELYEWLFKQVRRS